MQQERSASNWMTMGKVIVIRKYSRRSLQSSLGSNILLPHGLMMGQALLPKVNERAPGASTNKQGQILLWIIEGCRCHITHSNRLDPYASLAAFRSPALVEALCRGEMHSAYQS